MIHGNKIAKYAIQNYTSIFSMQKAVVHIHKVTDTEDCEYCDRTDTVIHYFFTCPRNNIFWQSFVNWWAKMNDMNTEWTLTKQDAMMGIWKTEKCDQSKIVMINYCLLLAKWIIHRCKVRNKEPTMYEFLCELRMRLNVENLSIFLIVMENPGNSETDSNCQMNQYNILVAS